MKPETLSFKNFIGYGNTLGKRNSYSRVTMLLDYLNKTNCAILPVAFLLGRISFLDGIMPFGMALFAATQGMNINRIFISIAVLAGMLSAGKTIEIFSVIAAMLLFNALNLPFKKSSGTPLRTAVIVFFSMLLPEITIILLQRFLVNDLLKLLLNGLVMITLVFVFDNLIGVLQNPNKRYNLSSEEVLSVAIACVLTAAGLGTWQIYGISIENILFTIIVLIFSYKTGAGNGAAIGIVVGTIISMTTDSTTIAIASFAISGLLSGTLKKIGKVGSCTGMFIGNMLMIFYTNGATDVRKCLYEIIISILLFMIIPERGMDFLVRNFDKSLLTTVNGDKKGYSTRIKDITVEKLNRFSLAFGEMAKTFDEISETKTITEKHDITAIFDRVADKVCKDCSLCMHCWEQNFYNTYQIMFKIIEKLDGKGWIEQADIPNYFIERCERVDDFVIAVNNVFELFKVDMVWRSKIGESRGLVSQQLKSMSKIISNLANELNSDISFKEDLENRIVIELSIAGIKNSDAIVYENKNGKLEITIAYKGCGGKRKCISVEKIVSKIVARRMIKEANECSLNAKSNVCTIKLVEEETFKVITGIARRAKNDKYISGDNYTFTNTGDGKYIAALSDGMGTGHKACIQSRATINLIEQFMESGFDKDTTVKLINSMLVLRSNDDSFTTIDISVVDLYEGEVEFVKVGAAPTFIKRTESVELVKTASLPAGILNDVEVELIHKKVGNGDFIIMLSDGIVDSFQDTQDSIKAVQNVINKMTSINPQKIADDLLEEALLQCKNREPVDDMLVMVSKVWKYK